MQIHRSHSRRISQQSHVGVGFWKFIVETIGLRYTILKVVATFYANG